MSFIKWLLFSALLAPLFSGAPVHAAEFEVLDRFSVDGYAVLRGSADISGGGFTVGGSAFVVKSGNIGIGTTSPNRSNVNIHGANRALAGTVSQLAITASDPVAADIGGSMHFGAHYDATADFAPLGYVSGRRENGVAGNYAGYLQFGVTQGNAGTIEAVRINSSGNVGIGTTGPQDLLHLQGPASAGAGIRFSNSPITLGMASIEAADAGSYGGSLYFKVHGNTGLNNWPTGTATALTILNSGNVGIGTQGPGARLSVVAANSGFSASFAGGNAAGVYPAANAGLHFSENFSGGMAEEDIWNTFDTASFPTTGIRFIQRLTASTYRDLLFLSNTGSVGLGTAGPKGKLDIDSNHVMGSKDAALSTAWTTVLSVDVGGIHRGAYIKVFIGGNDWGGHSAAGHYVEAFILNGGGAYGDPGSIVVDRHYSTGSMSTRLTRAGNVINLDVLLDSGSITDKIIYDVMGTFVSVN